MSEILPWHWLVLGILLLVVEVLGTSGFLIGIAIASFVQSLLTFFILGLSWELQLVIFAGNSMLFTFVYWRFFRKFNNKTDHETINNRAAQFIGKSLTLDEDIPSGEGKIQIGDALWKIRCDHSLSTGDTIKVVSSEGMTLVVERVEN